MWAFFLLATVYLEAGVQLLFGLEAHFRASDLGCRFVQDTIALAPGGLVTFAAIRLKNSPKRIGRKSRFKGSHRRAPGSRCS